MNRRADLIGPNTGWKPMLPCSRPPFRGKTSQTVVNFAPFIPGLNSADKEGLRASCPRERPGGEAVQSSIGF
jgi:hypothetical protein